MSGTQSERSDEAYGALVQRGPIHEEQGAVLLPAALAGAVAALVGGVAWGAIVRFSEYEVGIVAWVIGLLAGVAVSFAARGARGLSLQLVATVSALAGILVGKYLAFAWTVQGFAAEDGVDLSVVSGEMFSLFRDNLDTVFGAFDLLWVAFAVFTAWRMLRPEPASPPEATA